MKSIKEECNELANNFYKWCMCKGIKDPKVKTLRYWLSLKKESFLIYKQIIWSKVAHIHYNNEKGLT